jgi:hypothetical protein
MTDLKLQTLPVNAIQMRVAAQGSGRLVLLCDGFPEGWVVYLVKLRQKDKDTHRMGLTPQSPTKMPRAVFVLHNLRSEHLKRGQNSSPFVA